MLSDLRTVLRAKRRELGLSQEDLAREAGIDRTNLSRIERGEVAPTLETADRILTALGLTLRDVAEALDPPPDYPRHLDQSAPIRTPPPVEYDDNGQLRRVRLYDPGPVKAETAPAPHPLEVRVALLEQVVYALLGQEPDGADLRRRALQAIDRMERIANRVDG